jgi:Leucine-rich repeat (LRR) protein
VQHLGISTLQRLQELNAGSCLQQSELLAALSALTALTSVDIYYDDTAAAARAAPAWQHVPALHTLRMRYAETAATLGPAESLALLQGVATANRLTYLSINGPIVHDSVQLCAHLTGLTRLQKLMIEGAHLESRADVLHLTALTSLTLLDLWKARGVDDTAASVLALRLTQLQDLRLSCCSLRSAAALPSIATLTGLTSLTLNSNASPPSAGGLPLGRDELLLLKPLTRLKALRCHSFFMREAHSELWDHKLCQWRRQQT